MDIKQYVPEQFKLATVVYAHYLGIDIEKEDNLVCISEEALLTLPPNWLFGIGEDDTEGIPFFVNTTNNESFWKHPDEETWSQKVVEGRKRLGTRKAAILRQEIDGHDDAGLNTDAVAIEVLPLAGVQETANNSSTKVTAMADEDADLLPLFPPLQPQPLKHAYSEDGTSATATARFRATLLARLAATNSPIISSPSVARNADDNHASENILSASTNINLLSFGTGSIDAFPPTEADVKVTGENSTLHAYALTNEAPQMKLMRQTSAPITKIEIQHAQKDYESKYSFIIGHNLQCLNCLSFALLLRAIIRPK